MINEQAITPISDVIYQPEIVLKRAAEVARSLKSVIDQKDKQVIINDEQYLELEDWELVAHFYGLTVSTLDAVPTDIYGVKGAKAAARVVNRDGIIVGGAEAYCLRDESKWNTRSVYEWQGEGNDRKRVKVGEEPVPWFQLASMAQTRAASKACSNALRWVVVLAGYKGTPAEEMTGSEPRTERAPGGPHWCEVHKTHFFKKGKMRNYAHPIEGSDQWCSEPEASAAVLPAKEALFPTLVTPTATQVPSQPPAAQTGPLPAKKGTRAVILPDSVESVDAAQKIAEQCGMPKDTFLQVLGDNGLNLKSPPERVWQLIKPLLG